MQIAIQDAIGSDNPDVLMSSSGYATRFESEVGRWFLQIQEKTVLEMIRNWPNAKVLDVGGGHGQLTKGLIESGYCLTVLGSHEICSHRIQNFVHNGQCKFITGNVFDLPFPDNSFEVVISFRLMPHAKDWKKFIHELTRIARKAVVIDFASLKSINLFAKNLFWVKKKIEKNTTGFAVYEEKGIIEEFLLHGFKQGQRFAQYVIPMSFHRFLGNAAVSKVLESVARKIGLSDVMGSPIISCFVPKEDKAEQS